MTRNTFRHKWACDCPKLSKEQLKEHQDKQTFGSERQENWHMDVIAVNERIRGVMKV